MYRSALHLSALLLAPTALADFSLNGSDGVATFTSAPTCPSGWTPNQMQGVPDFCCPGSTFVNDQEISCCVAEPSFNSGGNAIIGSNKEDCLSLVPVTASDYSSRVSAALGGAMASATPTSDSGSSSASASATTPAPTAPPATLGSEGRTPSSSLGAAVPQRPVQTAVGAMVAGGMLAAVQFALA